MLWLVFGVLVGLLVAWYFWPKKPDFLPSEEEVKSQVGQITDSVKSSLDKK